MTSDFCTALCTSVFSQCGLENENLNKMIYDNVQTIIQENINNQFINWYMKKYLEDDAGIYLVKFYINLQSSVVSIQCQKKADLHCNRFTLDELFMNKLTLEEYKKQYIPPRFYTLPEKYLKELNLQKYKKEYTLCSPYQQ